MKYLIKLFPEITVKSRSERIHQTTHGATFESQYGRV